MEIALQDIHLLGPPLVRPVAAFNRSLLLDSPPALRVAWNFGFEWVVAIYVSPSSKNPEN
jgi:hypothetical protein